MSRAGADAGVGEIVDFDTLDEKAKTLIFEAIEARKKAYCPYSNFQVGACLECEDGSRYTGCNVENVAYNPCNCAERTAMFKAVSEGKQKFRAIAVIGDKVDSFTAPCGPCRQVMVEFSIDMTVYVTRSTLGKVLVTTSGHLLPFAFTTKPL